MGLDRKNIGYNVKHIQKSVNTKFLGLQIEDHLNWTNHIDKLIPELNGAFYAVRSMLHVARSNQFILPIFTP
jgi:hypothetical protein